MGLACSANKSARLNLLAMNAILVLMRQFQEESTPISCWIAYLVVQNLFRTIQGHFLCLKCLKTDTLAVARILLIRQKPWKKFCDERGLEVPENKEYSHGPLAHESKQGFEEFMEHSRACEDQESDGGEPVFKEAVLSMYSALPDGVKKKWMQILKRKLQISEVKPRKRLASKRNRKEDACHLVKKQKEYPRKY